MSSGEPHAPTTTRYQQQLSRAIGVIGNICITVSAITPTASIFIIAPVALSNQGSGAFLTFVIAAIIGLGMAMCYSELGSTFPIVGGQYSIVARVLGRPTGFLAFVNFLVLAIFIPSAIALGAGQYVTVLFPSVTNANLVGSIIMITTTLIAILSIRLNAVVTGIFLAIELLAVATVSVLGFANINQPLSILFSPLIVNDQGALSPLLFGALLTGVATAIFAYNGYDNPIVFSEEMKGTRRGIAKAVFWALGITVAAELIPVTAAILGAPSLTQLIQSPTPMAYVITELGGSVVNALVTVGVLFAIFNGNIAIILGFGRIIYSSGRDRAWPEPISSWLSVCHPTLKTPWVATALVGIIGTILTAVSSVASLVTFTGVVLTVLYGLVALSALVSRFTQKELERPYKMPLWPLWPIIGLVGCIVIFVQQSLTDIGICAAILLVAAIYYFAYLGPRRYTHWVMLRPAESDDREAEGEVPVSTGAKGEPQINT